jgi:hypothetical protein
MSLPHSDDRSPTRRASPLGKVALAALAAIAAAVRMIPIGEALRPEGIRLIPDGDPYYHVLRAQRIVEGHVDWFDRGINHPVGAVNPWPPAFDALLAAVSALAAPWSDVPARRVELAAVFLPVLLGVATVLAIAWLSRESFGHGATGAALVIALMPASFQYTHAGRADQHAAEALVLVAILIPFLRALRQDDRARRARASWLAGAFLALAFWTWLGSAFHLALLVLAGAACHIAGPDDRTRERFASALAGTAASASAVLVATLALLGPPGALRSGRVTGISGLSAALCGAAALGAAILARRSRRPSGRAVRLLEVVAAGAVAGAALILLPPVRSGIGHGLEALARGNAWYRTIEEFDPMLFGGRYPVDMELLTLFHHYGLMPLALLAAIPALAATWRDAPERRPAVILVATCAAMLLPLAAMRVRMNVYLAIPLALLVPEGIRWAVARIGSSRSRLAVAAALYAVALGPCVPVARALAELPHAPETEVAIRVAQRLRSARGSGDGGAEAGVPRGVLGPWSRGHHLRYYSGLQVLTTPFGTEGGEGAMEDAARFLLAPTQQEAEEVLARRRIGWVFLDLVSEEVVLGAELLGSPEVTTTTTFHGFAFKSPSPVAHQRVGLRLYYGYGLGGDGAAPLDGFRLIDEDASGPGAEPAKLFEYVAGARLALEGATPHAPVEAVVELSAPAGRTFQFVTRAVSDARGRAELRVPYAAGMNGRTRASACFAGDARRQAIVAIPESAVSRGERIAVVLR